MYDKIAAKKAFLLTHSPSGGADADDISNNVDTPPEKVDEPNPKPTPQYVSLETFQAEMGKLRDSVIGALATRGNPTPTSTPSADPWDPKNVEASTVIGEDDDAKTIAVKTVRRELAPLVQEFRGALGQRDQVNFSALDELGTEILGSKMPLYKSKPAIKKETDEILAGMEPHMRARPSARLTAYKLAIANHIDEIIEEGVTAKLRTVVKGDPPTKPSTGRHVRVFDAKKGVPTPQDLGYTEDQIASVEERYGDWDRFAVRISSGRYKNYEDYAKARAKQLGYKIEGEEPPKK